MFKFSRHSSVVYLSYKRAKELGVIWDFKEYFRKYENMEKNGYTLLLGAPLIRNIEGAYITDSSILDILFDQKQRFEVSKKIFEGKSIEYKWKRDAQGNRV